MARWRGRRAPAEIPAWVFGAPADVMWQWLEDAYGDNERRFLEALSVILSTPVPASPGGTGG